MARILITDDAAFVRLQLKDILTSLGHEVIAEAENGKESVERYKELMPDLVTMDIAMPELNGIDALKEIKRFNPNAKVIMCSATEKQAQVVESIQAGALDFVVKPFSVERIEKALKKLESRL